MPPLESLLADLKALQKQDKQIKKARNLLEQATSILAELGGNTVSRRGARKGGMSAAGRKAVAAAQRRRWRKVKAAKKAEKKEAKTAG